MLGLAGSNPDPTEPLRLAITSPSKAGVAHSLVSMLRPIADRRQRSSRRPGWQLISLRRGRMVMAAARLGPSPPRLMLLVVEAMETKRLQRPPAPGSRHRHRVKAAGSKVL